jgi:hypothetical protein
MILPEIIGDIATIGRQEKTTISELSPGDFVEFETSTLELVPLPTFAAYARQVAIVEAGQEAAGKPHRKFDVNEQISFAEKSTSANRALTFLDRLQSEEHPSELLIELFESDSGELFNALAMSNDDHVLALSTLPTGDGQILVFSVIEERYLKRNLAVFTIERPIRFFGRVAYIEGHTFLGIQSVCIALG